MAAAQLPYDSGPTATTVDESISRPGTSQLRRYYASTPRCKYNISRDSEINQEVVLTYALIFLMRARYSDDRRQYLAYFLRNICSMLRKV